MSLKLIMAVVLLAAPLIPFFPFLRTGRKNRAPFSYKLTASFLALLGVISYFGIVLSAGGELEEIIPPRFEWPVFFAQGVIRTDEGLDETAIHTPEFSLPYGATISILSITARDGLQKITGQGGTKQDIKMGNIAAQQRDAFWHDIHGLFRESDPFTVLFDSLRTDLGNGSN
jgi:hypothetical protein